MAKKETTNSPIVSIDPVTLQSYTYRNNTISFHNLNKAAPKREKYISYLPAKDIISGTVEVSRRLDDEDIDGAIESEAYESLGLDGSIEYKIIHLETDSSDSKNRMYNVFAFDSSLISKVFNDVKAKTKYIDYITAAPFLIGALYEKKLIEADTTDCFIYFQKNDAFLTIYKNGQYLYSKSLNYSLIQINEKFCELMGERVDEEDFFNLLNKEGLKTSNITYQQYLMQLFGEIFLYINDVIVFFKRSYSVETIDNVYLGTEVGSIEGMNEYSRSYLGIETKDFNFNTAKNKADWQIDQLQVLMMLTAQIYLEEQDDSQNITIFKRPPAFFKRPAGILILFLLLGLLGGLAGPAYYFAQGSYFQIDSTIKQGKYDDAHAKAEKIRATLADIARKRAHVDKDILTETTTLNFRRNLLNEIHEKKVNYPMKGVILDDLAKLINGRDIKVAQLDGEDRRVTISLRSKSDKQLTELLQDISKTNRYSVNTDAIRKLKMRQMYESNVTTGVLK